MINAEKFTDIEESFTRLKANSSDAAAQSKIADSLSSIVRKRFTVTVINPRNKNSDCSVMSIYPSESTVDALVEAILRGSPDAMIAKLWAETNDWTIEIDERILTRDVNLDPKELTALILHEVGHMIYSNSIPQRLSRVLKFEIAKTNMTSKEILKDKFFKKILYLPVLGGCGVSRNKDNIKVELKADGYAVKAGYRDALNSAMDKIIIYAGSKVNPDDEMKELTGFSIDSIVQLQNRQNHLVKRNLYTLLNNSESPFARKMLESFQTGLIGNQDGGWMTEAKQDEYINGKISKIIDDFYVSEAFFNRTKKMKRIDPADIDYIYLELNNIKTNDDKMMIISYIYNKLDTIDYYIALIDSKNPKYIIPHSRESLVQMREALDSYRKQAIERKLPEINYSVNIQYPEGYEG